MCVCYLFRCSHEVDGGVVAVVFLKQAEGELVVDQQVVWSEQREKMETSQMLRSAVARFLFGELGGYLIPV